LPQFVGYLGGADAMFVTYVVCHRILKTYKKLLHPRNLQSEQEKMAAEHALRMEKINSEVCQWNINLH
jgi:hypothetical protein